MNRGAWVNRWWIGFALPAAVVVWLSAGAVYAGQPREDEPPAREAPGQAGAPGKDRFREPADDQPRPGDRPGLRPMPARRPGMMLWQRMTPEERQELQSFMEEHFPQRYEEMLDLWDLDEGALGRYLDRVLPEMMHLKELSEHEPQVFRVRVQELNNEFKLRRLVRRYHRTRDEEARSRLEAKIRPLVEKRFDLHQKRMDVEIAGLEKRLEHLRTVMTERAERRDEEIEAEMERILNDRPRRGMRDRALGEPREPGQRRGKRPIRSRHGDEPQSRERRPERPD